jgi:hypothetical protein
MSCRADHSGSLMNAAATPPASSAAPDGIAPAATICTLSTGTGGLERNLEHGLLTDFADVTATFLPARS